MKSLTIVTILIILGSAESRYQPWNTTVAGVYNSDTEICCGGSVYPQNKNNKCCGSDVIDTSKQVCYNDVVSPLGDDQSCSGRTTLYYGTRYDDDACCDGAKVQVDPDVLPYATCCGKKAYDTRSQTCCYGGEEIYNVLEGANVPCCGDKTYEYPKEVCCTDYKDGTPTYRVLKSDDETKTSCCGDSVYDPHTETCCGGKVQAGMNIGCCGEKFFNVDNQICCQNQIMESNGKNACCGDKVYDSSTESCCSDYSPKDGESFTIVKNNGPNRMSCCGQEPYDDTQQLCCYPSKKVVTKSSPDHYQCCGDKSMSYRSGLCCNDVLFANVNDRTHECCGNQLVDKSKSSCCGNKIVEYPKACCGDSESYDSGKQLCCSAYNISTSTKDYSLADRSNKKIVCCGSKSYDLQKEICCDRSVVFPKSENKICCGKQLFNPVTEICCGGTTVFSREGGRESCCLYGTSD